MIDEQAVQAALATVHDPCSLATRTPLSLSEMGLIREVRIDDASGAVSIVMVVTSPACFLSESMAASIRDAVGRVDGVTEVGVAIDSDFRWTPDDIGADARRRLDERRERTKVMLDLRPQRWREDLAATSR